MDERKLISRLKKGDTRALMAVIDLYTPYVFAVVANVLASAFTQEDAEELVSESFTSMWYSREKLQPGKLKSYLAAIARNKAISHLRKHKLYEPLEDDFAIMECELPERKLLCAELSHLARKAVNSLPEPDREIFKRHYFLCQKTELIAETMNINAATVRTKLARGRRKLEDYLRERGYNCEDIHY